MVVRGRALGEDGALLVKHVGGKEREGAQLVGAGERARERDELLLGGLEPVAVEPGRDAAPRARLGAGAGGRGRDRRGSAVVSVQPFVQQGR